MKQITFLIVFILVGGLECQQPYIYGGLQAKLGQFPFMTYIWHEKGVCSSTLVTPDKVLSSATCYHGYSLPERVVVFAGLVDLSALSSSNKGFQDRYGLKLIIHEGYNRSTYFHDVAVLIVNAPFVLTKYVQLANVSTDKLSEAENCTAIGWGNTKGDDELPGTKLMYTSSVVAVPASHGKCPMTLIGNFFCLAGTNSRICEGDAGGPLICDGFVKGVASHVMHKLGIGKCGTGTQDVYVDLSGEETFWKHALGSSGAATKRIFGVPLYMKFQGAKGIFFCFIYFKLTDLF